MATAPVPAAGSTVGSVERGARSQSVLATAPPPPPAVPRPSDFLPGYRTRFTPHHRLVDYFEAVAAASDRVALERYGETYEGRPLLVAYVSAPENIARLDEIREDHLRRSGVLPGAPSGTTATAVVWLSYSVHGNEAAGSEASPRVLYDLATGDVAPGLGLTADSLARYLANTVVIIDPSLNPDGYTRYTDDVRRRSTLAPAAHPSAWEHVESWPNGRTNHYLFDLNRDWVWATQQETQARLPLYRRWLPHVHADVHEMGHESSYYFAPAAEPYHRYITDHQRDFQTAIGRHHAGLFDTRGWLYYTREVFDLLYPSYGDTYPTFSGAIGMTYEQAGSGQAGRAIARGTGDTLTLADRIDHHHATSLSTIAVASRHAGLLAREMRAYRHRASTESRGAAEAYLFPAATNDPQRLARLRALLDRHGIVYGGLTGKTRSLDGRGYDGRGYDGRSRQIDPAPGDLVVPARQAEGVLAQVLLDPESEVPDSLTYDITAWSLPAVMGLDAAVLTQSPGELAAWPAAAAGPLTPLASAAYGFAVPLGSVGTWAALAPRLAGGLVARVSSTPTRIDGRDYPAGTAFVLRGDQPGGDPGAAQARLASAYAALGAAGLTVQPVQGGFAERGYDLGSDRVMRLAAPTVILVQDDALDANAFGHVWHFFEQRLGYPIRPVPWSRLSAQSLAGVDVVIVTDGQLAATGPTLDALRAWVEAGGRLIAMEGAAEAIGRAEGFGLKVKEAPAAIKIAGEGPDPMLPYAERERRAIARNAPGALVGAQVDVTHPIGFGLPAEIALLRVGQREWAFLEEGYNVIGIRDEPSVRGFVGSEIRGALAETLAVGVQPVGRGDVVYAADNLAYRGFWEVGMQVLANAVFLR